MIELTFQDESPGDLQFHLVRGRVCPSRFTVVAEREARCGTTLVEARIIGASHAIVYNLAGMSFTEVLACSGPQEFGETLLRGDLDKLGTGRAAPLGGGATYGIRSRVVHGAEAERELAALEKRGEDTPDAPHMAALRFAFPSQAGGDVQAVTLLRAEVRGTGVLVETAHAYPQADACVLTEAQIGPSALGEDTPR